ncbi:SusD/RagB family nutrient-binding outer membrane lipoprotein [Luteirhabdus pelagi]|uniref:SusD/RagB family nutrient-binding outer membrane lipoprotein n=1 Tax=Luteirhabdus pelagi TaxID=2792783 RepID=UPI00193A13B4|nr:SusD/RagB family nutrient-binding outer membrane lipoprotein [Luteirhabdus pelagi]
MKSIYIKSILLAIVLTTFSCETIDTNLTEDPSNQGADEATLEFLINASQIGLVDYFEDLQFFNAQVSRMELMRNSPFYTNQFTTDTFDESWINAYADCLVEIQQLKEIASGIEDEEVNANNIIAMAQIMEAYVIISLVDTFGDVPYTEALQGGENLAPGRDSGKEIYVDAIALLQNSINLIDAGGSVNIPSDLYYDGDEEKWRALANSLLLKAIVQSRLESYDNIDANAIINSIIDNGGFISNNNGDFQFDWSVEAEPESRHPLFTAQYIAGASLYMSEPWIRRMEDDPRFNYYFYLQNGEIFGREHGDAGPNVAFEFPNITVHGLYPVGGKYNDGTTGPTNASMGAAGAGASIIMTQAFSWFYIAEAELMMNNDPVAARNAYEAGIQASMDKVTNFRPSAVPSGEGATSTEINDYIAEALQRYDDAAGTDAKLNEIITEFYKAAWGNGFEVYNNLRRTSYPDDLAPSIVSDPGTFTYTMYYPAIYVNNNSNPDAQQKSIAEKAWWAQSTSFNLDY